MSSKNSDADIGKIFANSAGIIKQNLKTFALAAVVFGVLYAFLYGIWKLPLVDFGFTRTSEVGLLDWIYISAITAMSAALMTLMRYKVKASKGSSRVGGVGGLFAGFVAAACPACQGVTLVALGSTLAFLPIGALSSFVWVMQLVALFILWISVYMVSYSIYTKTCITCEIKPDASKPKPVSQPSDSHLGHHLLDDNKFFSALVIITMLVIANQFLIGASGFAVVSSGSGGTVTLAEGFNYGSKITLKPMPIAVGEEPNIQGYKSKVKSLPTISELQIQGSTGDVAQDLVNNVVPSGTPWYGAEAGVSFDDPITAQQLWAKGKAIQLDSVGTERWNRIVNSFTCDYCCGSPQQPTVITRCGCAHASAAQGMAKWFIQNYGDKYSDEEIYGEMARWYALWYPGPTVKRIAEEMGLRL